MQVIEFSAHNKSEIKKSCQRRNVWQITLNVLEWWRNTTFRQTLRQSLTQLQISRETKKASKNIFLEAFKYHLVGVKGFEPSTPCTPCKCATRLRHTPI